jgi:hypothetical protein
MTQSKPGTEDRLDVHLARAGSHQGGGAVLVGRSALCDLRLPAGGSNQHILIVRADDGFEVRDLSRWHRMRVNGAVKNQPA